MKIRYFIPTFMAALAMLVGCSDNDDPTYLDGLKVSQSYVSLPAAGGSAQIVVNAGQAWNFTDVPAWLTVSPDSGEAGENTVTLTAAAATETMTATIHLNSGGMVQEINIIQQTEKGEVPLSTCADVIAGEDGKTYRVKGTVTRIANTEYGNWYLQDETGEVYIYGTLDKSGKDGKNNSIAAWGIGVGDIVTVEGPRKDYNGTIEMVNVTVIDIEKSLLSVESVDPADATLPLEGGDFKVTLSNKGNGITSMIPDDAKDWLFVSGVTITGTTCVVTLHATANVGGDRSATISFVTTDNGKEYTCETTVKQKGAIVEAPIADFLAAEVGDTQYRLTGVITKIAKAEYGNIYLSDYSGEVYVYGIGAKGEFEALGLKEGDVITIVGKRGVYNNTPQMVNGAFEALKYAVTAVTIDEFLTKEDADNVYYMVTGVVDEIANPTYGNLYLKSGETRLYVYGCYPGWGASGDARKGCIDNYGIEVGDELTVIGVKSTFNGTPQLKNGIYFSYVAAGSE